MGIVSRTRRLLFMVQGGRDTLVLAAGALVVLAIAAVALYLWRRRRQAAERASSSVPLLVFPAAPVNRPRVVRQVAPVAPAAPVTPVGPIAPVNPPAGAPYETASAVTVPRRVANGAGEAAHVPARSEAAPAQTPAPAVASPAPSAHASDGPEPLVPGDSLVDGRTVRFYKPSEGTLQILPGRLEIVDGADEGQSIRFVQTGNTAEVTFGRSDGPPYRHIQLRAPTVSRQHARMFYEDSTWRILNLSQTNPVIVNGEELALQGNARRLQDGDRIEMGEVTFLFRER